jgi:hypothetical protein
MKQKSFYNKLLILSVFICGVIALTVFMFQTQYYLKNEVTKVTSFSNSEEIFVFVEITHFGRVESRFKILLESLLNLFPGTLQTLRRDTIACRYAGGKEPQTIVTEDFAVVGEVVWFEGSL